MTFGLAGGRPRLGRGVVFGWVVAGAVAGGAAEAAGPTPAACGEAAAAIVRVAGRDGTELVLDDGRRLRLATVRPAAPAVSALERLAGRSVRVHGAAAPDRWGRLVADAVDTDTGWLEADLARAGAAVVTVPARLPAACARALLAAEAAARADSAGLWATTAPLPADDAAAVAAMAGRHVVVEGRIRSVGERRGTVYLNFGDRWSEDFTVTVSTRDRAAVQRGGLDVATLAGARVRVRGHVERRGGPLIAVTGPGQIERLEAVR